MNGSFWKVMLIVTAVLLGVNLFVPTPKDSHAAKSYEYKVMQATKIPDVENFENVLNKLSKQGYEFVSYDTTSGFIIMRK